MPKLQPTLHKAHKVRVQRNNTDEIGVSLIIFNNDLHSCGIYTFQEIQNKLAFFSSFHRQIQVQYLAASEALVKKFHL